MKHASRACAFMSVVVISTLVWAAVAQEPPLTGLDDYIAQAMTTFQVPGVAVAVVKDGKVVLAKGYGIRKLGEPRKVDEHTLFGIGSNTKAFTTAALATLVDEGKIQWDDRVFEWLPGFQMYDPYVSHEMTIRDLLTHRSGMGLGEGDLLAMPPSDYTSSEIIHKLRYMKPASSFRSKFDYDNLLYMVAGEVIPSATGKSWKETIRDRIFKPLNMIDSNASVVELQASANFAIPHSLVEGKLTPITPWSIESLAPAGAINSSAADMAKWVIAQLDGGAISGTDQRLFSESSHREMWSAQTVIEVRQPPPALAGSRTNFVAYGLGWFLSDYRGRKQVSHTGGLPGYVSRVTMIPDLKLGVVVLTNQESGMMFNAVTWRVLDRYMDAPDYDWVKAGEDVIAKNRADNAGAEEKQSDTRALDSKPSLPLEKYAGNYQDAWYGNIAIAMEQGKLVMRFTHTPALTGELEHWQYNTFKVRWRDRSLGADAFATFNLDAEGGITEVKMKPVSPSTDFSFDFQDLTILPVKKK